jgi:hypothetical protein
MKVSELKKPRKTERVQQARTLEKEIAIRILRFAIIV